MDLCSVASGSADAYYERGVNLWDIAAGSLIAIEAGAQVTGLHGRPASPSMTMAAAAPLLGELHDLLASLDPRAGRLSEPPATGPASPWRRARPAP